MTTHKIINSKMKKMGPLFRDPILSKYLPDTHWYSEERLVIMFKRFKTLYIKPDRGRRGIGVSRIKRLNDQKYELSYEDVVQQLSFSNLVEELGKRFVPEKYYLIQEGIDLSTYNKCPFHIRVIMQKPLNRWQSSLVSGIVAKKKNAVVTNVSRGNMEVPVDDVLLNHDQQWNPHQIQRELIDLSHQFAHVLGSKFPLTVMGLDMAIDKKGNIWFIEANTKPNIFGTDKANNEKANRKFQEAKKWIGTTKPHSD